MKQNKKAMYILHYIILLIYNPYADPWSFSVPRTAKEANQNAKSETLSQVILLVAKKP